MIPALRLRTGFEIELLAPKGASRLTLATELARRCAGEVRPVWHHDSEPSLVPGLGRFLHLTQAFEVRDLTGELICTLADDITLRDDLDATAAPARGWYRVLTDDTRLLHLLAKRTDPGAQLRDVLAPLAELWNADVAQHGDVFQLNDPAGATIALAAAQGGERERPCEVITPPLVANHRDHLDALLAVARELDFTVPKEAAVHLHYDGAPFRSSEVLANIVRLFAGWRPALHHVLRTNPACRRLGALPAILVEAANGTPTFAELRAAAQAGGLTKFFDINLTQLFAATPLRDTVEIRILPGSIDADHIGAAAALVEGLLARCADPTPIPAPPADVAEAIDALLLMTDTDARLRPNAAAR